MIILPLPAYNDLTPGNSLVAELLAGLLYGGKCLGYQQINVDDQAVYTFTVPTGAQIAILYVDADAGAADLAKVIHWREDGNDPTTGVNGEGMILGDSSNLDIRGAANLNDFRMIAREALTHIVRVQYYGKG